MDWKLEVVIVPVADVDRAKSFYADKIGFSVDHDTTMGAMRFVQLTPPGSACSIVIGPDLTKLAPGSLEGLQLVVSDINSAHAELVARGVACSDVQVFDVGGPRPSRAGDNLDNVGFVYFSDPDGNAWAVQQISR
jgi:catechol 2,3-dioxygenase-like lactoylglutathione lyase family enzyme